MPLALCGMLHLLRRHAAVPVLVRQRGLRGAALTGPMWGQDGKTALDVCHDGATRAVLEVLPILCVVWVCALVAVLLWWVGVWPMSPSAL